MLFRESIQVYSLFDDFGKEIYLSTSDNINQVVSQLLLEKKQSYSGQDYLEQLEKNVIYLCEGTTEIKFGIFEYLVNGQPILNAADVFSFVNSKAMSHETTRYHWDFVRYGCNGCPVHNQHGQYENLRNFRLSGAWMEYLEDLEYSYEYNQTEFMVSKNFFIRFLHNHELAGVARKIPQQDIVDALIHGIRIWANVCLGYIQYADNLVQQQAPQSPKTTSIKSNKSAKRIGWFVINAYYVENNPDMVKRIMANMVVIDTEFMPDANCYKYTAYSDLFDPVEPGSPIPSYSIESRGNGIVTVRTS